MATDSPWRSLSFCGRMSRSYISSPKRSVSSLGRFWRMVVSLPWAGTVVPVSLMRPPSRRASYSWSIQPLAVNQIPQPAFSTCSVDSNWHRGAPGTVLRSTGGVGAAFGAAASRRKCLRGDGFQLPSQEASARRTSQTRGDGQHETCLEALLRQATRTWFPPNRSLEKLVIGDLDRIAKPPGNIRGLTISLSPSISPSADSS